MEMQDPKRKVARRRGARSARGYGSQDYSARGGVPGGDGAVGDCDAGGGEAAKGSGRRKKAEGSWMVHCEGGG